MTEDALNNDRPFQETSPAEIHEFDFTKDLQQEVNASFQVYQLSSIASQTIPVNISLKTNRAIIDPAKNLLNRANIDLICVVDTSSSMRGEKIRLVIQTLNYILSLFTENDLLSLITFSHNANKLIDFKKSVSSEQFDVQGHYKQPRNQISFPEWRKPWN